MTRRKPADDDDDAGALLRDVNAVTITPQEMRDYSDECNELRETDPDNLYQARMFAAVRHSGNNATKAMALALRMDALRRLLNEGAPGWVKPNRSDDDLLIVEESMISAAAVEPLIGERWQDFHFDRTTFMERALKTVKTDAPIQ